LTNKICGYETVKRRGRAAAVNGWACGTEYATVRTLPNRASILDNQHAVNQHVK